MQAILNINAQVNVMVCVCGYMCHPNCYSNCITMVFILKIPVKVPSITLPENLDKIKSTSVIDVFTGMDGLMVLLGM